MKRNRNMLMLVPVLLSGCSSGPSGDYGGSECGLYDKLSFRDNGKVYLNIKMFGIPMGESAGDYTVDKDKVVIRANNQTTVFTMDRNGDLESTLLGSRIICRKLDSNGNTDSARITGGALNESFGGKECVYDRLVFSRDGTVELTLDNMRRPGSYRMEGNQVMVSGEEGTVVFTLDDDRLEAMVHGQRSVCDKL